MSQDTQQPILYIYCKTCKRDQDVCNFYFDKNMNKYLTHRCHICQREKYKQKEEKYNRANVGELVITCNLCKEEKDSSRFEFNKRKNQYRKSACKDCRNKKDRDQMKIDEDYRKKRNGRKSNWVERNRDRFNEYNRNRRQNNIQFYLKDATRRRINRCVNKHNNRKYKKTYSSEKYLGCDIDTYIEWLEFNFHDGMTWENRGVYWHIDHVTPCASFDLSNEDTLLACFNWKNTYPLIGEKNVRKQDTIDLEYIEYVKSRVDEFLRRKTSDLIVESHSHSLECAV